MTCEYEHSGSKHAGPSDGSEGTKQQFSQKMVMTVGFCFSNLWRPSFQMLLHRQYLQENNGTPSGGPNVNCHFSLKLHD
jgi:hypothetical protein